MFVIVFINGQPICVFMANADILESRVADGWWYHVIKKIVNNMPHWNLFYIIFHELEINRKKESIWKKSHNLLNMSIKENKLVKMQKVNSCMSVLRCCQNKIPVSDTYQPKRKTNKKKNYISGELFQL